MLVRVPGWEDADVLALLTLFRTHLRVYIYASVNGFVETAHAELPDKSVAEIQEMARQLIQQFGVVLSTKNFRSDVIQADGQEIYVHEHLYETMSELLENKIGGGLWLPDELICFFQKAKQYHSLLQSSPEVYFKRIQIWGKSVAETKSKFYALRDMYLQEKHRTHRKGVDARRFELMQELFDKAPPAFRAPKVGVINSKAPKLWSPGELAMLVDFLVRITKEVQTTGTSELVKNVTETLHRTDQSCMNKLTDMRDRYLKNTTYYRAAHLPDTIYDPNSEAHKIFNADWNDLNDPYALGFRALRSWCLKVLAVLSKNRRKKELGIQPSRRKLRPTTTREASADLSKCSAESKVEASSDTKAAAAMSSSHTGVKRTDESKPAAMSPASHLPRQRATAEAYTEFVRDMAAHCEWTDKVVFNVLRCMQHSIELYRADKLVAFFHKIAGLTPGVTFRDLFAHGEYILTSFEKHFGTLKKFEHLVLTKSDPDASADHYGQVVEEQERAFEPLGGAEPSMLDTPNASPSWDEDGRPTPEKRIANERGDDEHGDGVRLASSTYEGEEKSSSAPGKQSSPENDNWDGEDGASDGDADVDDDGLENQSVDSSDNAWSGSSNTSDAKRGRRDAKDKASPADGYSLSKGDAFGFDRTKKPSKRGKDENYGKRFVLAKKRRFEAKKPSADKKDDDEDGVEGEDDGDQQSEDANNEPPADSESVSSEEEEEEEEEEEKPHPLQGILDSLDAHIANLQAKQRELIERKEDRERRQYRHMRGEYGTSMDDMQSYLSGA